ncbi:MAG: hypothetical protein ACLQVW_18485, partial [Limisphaerales bacterium]
LNDLAVVVEIGNGVGDAGGNRQNFAGFHQVDIKVLDADVEKVFGFFWRWTSYASFSPGAA